jgi:hypothetical protein
MRMRRNVISSSWIPEKKRKSLIGYNKENVVEEARSDWLRKV